MIELPITQKFTWAETNGVTYNAIMLSCTHILPIVGIDELRVGAHMPCWKCAYRKRFTDEEWAEVVQKKAGKAI